MLTDSVWIAARDASDKVAATSCSHCLRYLTLYFSTYLQSVASRISVKFFSYNPQTFRNTPL